MKALKPYNALKNALFDLLLVISAYLISLPLQSELAFLAPITVLILIQPSRGKTYHMGLQRLMGTVFGSILAILLISFLPGKPYLIVVFLTVFVSLFAGLASLGHTMNGYIFQLTGYTSAIVFMSTYGSHQEISEVGSLRVMGTLIGLFVALLGLAFFKKESDRVSLDQKSQKVKELLYQWVRAVLKEGVTQENISIREELFKKASELNALSYYAASERFSFSSIRKKTLHLMGSVYTILSVNRSIVRRLTHLTIEERKHLTEEDFPVLAEQFKKMESSQELLQTQPVRVHWKGFRIGFARTLLGGLMSGGIWMALGIKAGATFFLVTIIHCCLLTTNHRPMQRYLVILKSLGIVFIFLFLYFSFFEMNQFPDFFHFILLLFPGILLRFIPSWSYLGLPVNLFTLILYSILTAYENNFKLSLMVEEFMAFTLAIILALLLTRFFYPQRAQERFYDEESLLLKELEKMTKLQNPLNPDWMMTMYAHVERMMFYSEEIKMDENDIINEGLSLIDICVELLELRSRIAYLPSDIKLRVFEVINNITNRNLSLEARCGELDQLSYELRESAKDLVKNIEVIANKMRLNQRLFQ